MLGVLTIANVGVARKENQAEIEESFFIFSEKGKRNTWYTWTNVTWVRGQEVIGWTILEMIYVQVEVSLKGHN